MEEYLSRRPDKAEAVRHAGTALPPVEAPPDAERRALDRTRELISHRQSFFGVARIFTLLPCSFTFSGGHIRFLMLRDGPVIAAVWLSVALIMWTAFAIACRRLGMTGLQTASRWPLWSARIATPWMVSLWLWTGSAAAVLAPVIDAGLGYAASRWITGRAIL